MTDVGRLTGSRASMEPASGLHPSGFDPERDEFLALADRCEQSLGDNMVELLEDAFVLCCPKPARIWVTDNTGDWTPEYADYHARSWGWNDLMEATAYLDAACALLAPHTLWAVGSMEDGPFARLCWPMPDGGYGGGYVEGHASGAALSLCAAALRGHAIAMEAASAGETEGLDGNRDSAGLKGIAQTQSDEGMQ